MEEKRLIELFEDTDNIEVKTKNEEFIIIKKSKTMAYLDFIHQMVTLLMIGSVALAITIVML